MIDREARQLASLLRLNFAPYYVQPKVLQEPSAKERPTEPTDEERSGLLNQGFISGRKHAKCVPGIRKERYSGQIGRYTVTIKRQAENSQFDSPFHNIAPF